MKISWASQVFYTTRSNSKTETLPLTSRPLSPADFKKDFTFVREILQGISRDKSLAYWYWVSRREDQTSIAILFFRNTDCVKATGAKI